MQEQINDMVRDHYFDLPQELIARFPAEPADSCRLMTVDVQTSTIHHGQFGDLLSVLEPGDLLVVNDTRVEKRRVFLRRQTGTKNPGARIEAVFLEPLPSRPEAWKALIKKRQRLNDGEELVCERDPETRFTVNKKADGQTFLVFSRPLSGSDFERIGQMPIPPYLKREADDRDDATYQNPFHHRGASAAAPTAALHFTPRFRQLLSDKGVRILSVSLDIGYGTFAPLSPENFETGKLHSERYEIPEGTAEVLREKKYNRIYAVGTTALRVLETVHRNTSGRYDASLSGMTDAFFYPPARIASVDGLVTNFHLPGSSLLLLVSCLCGRELLLRAYNEAVNLKYRFFSYGDAMMILNRRI